MRLLVAAAAQAFIVGIEAIDTGGGRDLERPVEMAPGDVPGPGAERQFGQHAAAAAVEALTRLGERQAARGAHQQRGAKLGFECGDAPADDGRRQGQPMRRFGEVAAVGHGNEGLDGSEVGDHFP